MPYQDPERRRAYGREWMRRNLARAREAMRRWRQNNAAAHNASNRAYYARNAERIQRRMDAGPNRASVRRAVAHRRREAVRGKPSFTAEEWRTLVARYLGRCAYCGAEGPQQVDHRLPLARGGSNTIENILPACRSCNARKALLTEEEFRRRIDAEGDAQ